MPEPAEKLPYWKTSKSGSEKWIARAKLEIERAGGEVLSEGYGADGGRAAFLLRFRASGQTYRIVWPCASESKWLAENEKPAWQAAARRQAATMLYHDVKAACVKARVLGFPVAFLAHAELEDGRVAGDLSGTPAQLPNLLGTGAS